MSRKPSRIGGLAVSTVIENPSMGPASAPDFRQCPFCDHALPIVVTVPSGQPAYVIACLECGATGPK